ncbi:MAG TPA: ankyrin repeat domain-containing protein, partial [Candidatus Acidoferrales bacterium]|nr:ankyrin repeat domain-containing protein [Candidatus Acidoferrales bacterium]
GERLFPALFSGIECIFSQAVIERWEGEGNKGTWVHVATIVHPPRPSFLLSDASASVMVLPAGADFQLRSTRYEHGDPIAQGGEDLLAMHDPSGTARFRIEEKMLDQDSAAYVYGFATQASMVPAEAQPLGASIPNDKLVVWNRPGSSDFIIADEAPQALASDLRRSFALGIVGGPAAILVGVAALLWCFISPLGGKLSLPFPPRATPAIVYLPNVNRQSLDGTTQLMRAAKAGEAERIEQLLRSGADPNIVDNQGRTALHYAVLARSELAVSALLRAQPLLNLQDEAGNTPLHLAVHLGDVVVIEELLAAGADTSVPNLAKQTPLDAARKRHGPDAAAIILTLQNASHL